LRLRGGGELRRRPDRKSIDASKTLRPPIGPTSRRRRSPCPSAGVFIRGREGFFLMDS